MKKVIKCLRIILFLMLINILEISNINAATNPYKEAGPYGTNCTWYAWKMANEKAGVALPGWSNAKNWYNDAQKSGYRVGTKPQANSIIVWGDWTSYGHVGYVEKVEGNILHVWDSTGPCIDEKDPEFLLCEANSVSEETSRICYEKARRIACEYTISPSQYSITGYIYLDYAPQKPTPSVSQNNDNTSKKEEQPTTVIVPKSSNANLNNINLSNGSIKFNKNIFEYNLVVENEIDKLTITATAEDDKATIKGTGDYELNTGLNVIKLVVTAEDSSIKEYIIQVTRNKKIEVEPDLEINDNQTENVVTKNNDQQTTMLVLGICFIILLSICLILLFTRKKHKSK